MRILSLDVSSASTGWSFVNTDNIKTVLFSNILIKDNLIIAQRLDIFRKELILLFNKYKPDAVVIEDTFVGMNPAVTKLLAKFGGIAEQLTYEFLSVPPMIVSNKTVKAFFKVKTKQELYYFVCGLLDWDSELFTFKKYNDITDSIAQLLYSMEVVFKLCVFKETHEYGFKFREVFITND